MRFPEKDENLIGKVCICSVGRIAVVSGRQRFEFGESWVGIGFDGKGAWASKNPVVAYESVEELRQIIQERFKGKMSYN